MVTLPPFPYAMNGVLLDSQPYIWTQPSLSGTVIPRGESFLLLFVDPVSSTLLALQDGVEGTMTFLVDGSRMVSGPVQVSSTAIAITERGSSQTIPRAFGSTLLLPGVAGMLFHVHLRMLSDITLSTRVILTQFF